MLKPRHWQEPAHPQIVKNFDDLVTIYKVIREQLQPVIDETFDRISRQIGFIVSTTLPVAIEAGKDGKIASVNIGAADLENTIFAKEFTPVFERLRKVNLGKATVTPGSYSAILLWQDALRIKLKHDWMEPAHLQQIDRRIMPSAILAEKVRPEVQEPAHWFDSRFAIDVDEGLLINVIDEVYPELKLAERVAMSRTITREFAQGVREPAHYIEPQTRELSAAETLSPALAKSAALEAARIRPEVMEPAHLKPGVREPAHYLNVADLMSNPEKQQLLQELSAILKKLNL